MKATVLFSVIIIGSFLSSSTTVVVANDQDSPSPCHCNPVRNFSVELNGNGTSGCAVNKTNDELLQELKELKSELSTLKNRLGQIQPGRSGTPFDLHFTQPGTEDFVIHHGLAITSAFTTCFRTRSSVKSGGGRAVVSYSTNSHDNEMLIINLSQIRIVVNNEVRQTYVSANNGKWHHICVTWENQAGSWKLYKDGIAKASGTGLKPGYVIKTNGIVVIGQEQDSFGGSFKATQSYVGELTDLNIWNRVLSARDIYNLAQSCNGGRGNVKKWSDFKVGIRGDLRVVSPSVCKTRNKKRFVCLNIIARLMKGLVLRGNQHSLGNGHTQAFPFHFAKSVFESYCNKN